MNLRPHILSSRVAMTRRGMAKHTGLMAAVCLTIATITTSPVAAAERGYAETNLASNLPGTVQTVDQNLVNPWGLSHGLFGPWWISDNNAGSASVYTGAGTSVSPPITVPTPTASTGGTPTGNATNILSFIPWFFRIHEGSNVGPSNVLFSTEDGTILGWNKQVDSNKAVVAVDRSTASDAQGDVGAVYKGVALGFSNFRPYVYATNFRFGTVEMFDSNFNLVRSFTDPQLSSTCPVTGQCYAPFGIQNIGNKLYVSFALQQADKHDDQAGNGNGFVDVFNTDGTLEKRLIAHGALNSPWGLAMAPHDFGTFSNDLLVGNFGDGMIHAYNPNDGTLVGTLDTQQGAPLHIDGLWGLAFGNGFQAGRSNELFFTAGLNNEANGLFGKITEVE